MNSKEMIELKNCDPEDISDVLVIIERSFGIKLLENELSGTNTFGELCDIISARIQLEHADDCTAQQA